MSPEVNLVLFNEGYSVNERALIFKFLEMFPDSFLPSYGLVVFFDTFLVGLRCAGGMSTLEFLQGSPEDRATIEPLANQGKWEQVTKELGGVHKKSIRADKVIAAFKEASE